MPRPGKDSAGPAGKLPRSAGEESKNSDMQNRITY
ncbi:hypothetical protein CLOLEP_01089 [[Clostridium] leptum DSM 753]|uniref:Uncharacterized protein n=1 Tax=[Clostridium] leptum DSM 753 TaxID=428125 RepID=A7VRA6_9FIRM|nr:hypothetical protein CLOLEP_01089 [[Clostridium] leptum DSM 753]